MSVQVFIPTSKSISNPYIINGVAHFVQDTKPTVRLIDGVSSPLVVRDKWYKTDDGTEWFWNGTYWLEKVLYSASGTGSILISPGIRLYTINMYGASNLKGAVFVDSVAIVSSPGNLVSFGDINNHKRFQFSFWHQGGQNSLIHLSPASYLLPSGGYLQSINSICYPNGFQVSQVNVGSPINYLPLQTFYYRNFYPL